ncbi:unnamed protein product, partial [Polarella glacialis]
VNEMSNFARYERELQTGHLKWGFIHSSKFWAENALMFEANDFRALKLLAGLLLSPSTDSTTLAVACHDLGEFVTLHPFGKKKVAQLQVKERVMELMGSTEADKREVRREALLCCQKLMLNKWQDMGKCGKGVEEQLQYEANCLEAEVGSFSLDLERSEAEVKRLEAETSDLRAAVGCCEEALASMEQFEEENKDLLVELHKFTDCSRSAAVPCRLGAPPGGEERAQRPSRSRSPGLIPGRPRARRVAAESLDSRLLVKAPGAEEHIAGTPRPRLHSCSSGMSPRSDFNLQESFHRSRWVLAVDAPQLLRGF